MRSRVVPMREMKAKFGAEVRDFPYSFVLPRHPPDWDDRQAAGPEAPAKLPVYIEIKKRPQ